MENKFGKTSCLNLTAVQKEDKTILADCSFTAPFKIMRPFYEKSDIMTVMLLTASAGIMAGDRQEFHFHISENAKMEFISQAYEKIHKMEDGSASRHTKIIVDKNAEFWYTPLPTIPFTDSDYSNYVDVELADDTSKFVMSEVLSCGRVAHNEKFGYRLYKNQIQIRKNGKLIYRDNTRYEPFYMDMNGFGMYESFTHLANLIICNDTKDEEWLDRVRQLIDDTEEIEGGATYLASGDIVIRILGRSGQALTQLMEKILQI